MKRWTKQPSYLCILAAAVLVFVATAVFAADSGPLDIGTRLLELQQPVVQVSAGDKTSVYAYVVDEDMDFVNDPAPFVKEEIGDWISGQTCAGGGCLRQGEEGGLVDDRFLFSAGTCSSGLRLMRVEAENQYDHDDHPEFPDSVGTPRTDGSNFIDVATSDWNGDGYPDFALLYLGKHNGNYAFYLVLVDGCPDGQGAFTCHFDDSWRWTLQDKHDGGMTQGRIAAGDVDGDGADELVLHLGNKKIDGDNFQNMLGVYEVSESLGLGDGVTRSVGETRKDWDGLDVTVGDFRGNGKIEMAAISSNKCDVWLKVWEFDGTSIRKTADLGDVGTLPENKDYPGYLRCVAGDLNGDGRDEIIWAGGDRHTDRGDIAVVVHTNLDEDGGLSFYKCPAQYPLIGNAGHPIFDLALGYFSEGFIPSDTGYPNQMQIAVVARVNSNLVNRTVLSWDGEVFSQGGVTVISPVDFDDANDYPTVVAADMLQQTLSLGDPEHSKVVAQLTPVVAMQAPPRHWDRIGSEDVDAFSAFSGYKTSFSLESSSTETTQTSSQSSVSSTYKPSTTGGYKFFGLVDTELSAAYAYTSKKVEEDLAKNVQTSTMKLTAEAAKDDWLYYTFQNLDIWRYPILGQAGQEVTDEVTTDQLYYQVVCPDDYTTMTSDGRDKEWYAPVHENQNLLSYPNAVEYIEGYPEASGNILYGGPDNLIATTVGAEVSGTRSNSFNSVTFEQEKDSHSVSNGVDASLSVSGKIFGAKVGGGFSYKYDNAFSETSTNSVNLANALGFTVAVPEGSSYFFKDGRTSATARFDLYETAFLTNGKQSLVSAYAVDLLGRNSGSLWTNPDTSPYWQMSDPALNLPQKWELQTVAGTYSSKTQWVLCESESTRDKVRGGFAYQADDDWSYDEDVPEIILIMDEPGKVVLRCRVYNYSFVDCEDVDVKFSCSYAGKEGSGLPTEGETVEIETVTLGDVPAWTSDGPRNWVWAEVEWDTSDLSGEGGYWIHVEVDPEDHVAEIHDNGDEAGNNAGWYEIGLLKQATMDELASEFMDGTITARSAVMEEPEEDLEDVSLVMDNMEAGEGETTLVRTEVANRGDRPLAMVHVGFYEFVGGEWRLFDEEIVPVLLAGEIRTLEVPFTPTSSESNVKVVIDPRMGEADFENNSARITRSTGSGGCSVSPFSGALLCLPLLLAIKRR